MSPLEKRLKELRNLKELEEGLPNPTQTYIADLNLTIKQCEVELKTVVSKKGYRMVDV